MVRCNVYNLNTKGGMFIEANDEKIVYIYKITNKINGFVYIGQTIDVHRRWLNHLREVRYENESPLYKAMREYGVNNFSIEVIDKCFYSHRHIIEEYYTRQHQETGKSYNIISGCKLSKDLRLKIQEVRKANDNIYHTKEFSQKISSITCGENNGMYGKKDNKAINGQHVFMLDDNKNIIKEFVSVKEAMKFLGLRGHTGLNKACLNGYKYHGYYWVKTWKTI